MSALEVRSLRVAFEDLLLFDGVDLTVDTGEIIAIETGVLDGGTSLLKALAGLLRGCEGEVRYRNENLLHGASPEVTSTIGFVYEDRGLISLYTTYQNISLPLRFHSSLSNGEIRHRAETLCRQLGMNLDVLALRPHQLNDVQTRLVNLARALIVEPGLLLIDEIEGGMSDEVLAATMATIKGYQEAHPMAVIMTTSSDFVLEQADRIYDIEHSTLVAQAG